MSKRWMLALLVLLWLIPVSAYAQNTTCATRAPGDSSNACASTAFVNGASGGGGTPVGHFTPGLPLIGAPNGFIGQGTRSSTSGSTQYGTVAGTPPVDGNCPVWNSGNLIDSGVTCGSGGGGVTAGLAGQFTYYPANGTSVAGTYGPSSTEMWVNPNGSDSNSGINPAFPKLTLAAALTALSSGGTLHVTGGMFTIPATLQPQAFTTIDCDQGSGFTQANGTNLIQLIDFNAFAANSAVLRHCIIDGNNSNQTVAIGGYMINIGNAANVTVEWNLIENPVGDGVGVTNGVGVNIVHNHFHGGTYDNVTLIPSSAVTPLNFHVDDNTSDNLGAHFLEMYGADRGSISGNVITGFTINSIVANITSATAVVWVSGPQFTTLRPGNFIICGSGANYQELFITKVNSATSLTISSATPGAVRSNQNCIAGPGDLMDITGSFLDIGNNVMIGGTTGGIVVNNFLVVETVQQVHVHDNNISNVGNGCIFVEAIPQSGAIMVDDSYTGNHMNECAEGQTPLGAKAGIIIDDGAPTGAINQWFDGNVVTDSTGNTGFWMAMFGSIVQAEAQAGSNTSRGVNATGIFAGLRSVTLSSGWGAGATVNSSITNGSSFKIVITAGSSGLTVAPTVTINKAISGGDIPPQPTCSVTTTSGVPASSGVSTASIDQDIINLQGTPAAGVGYIFYCKE